MLPRRALKIVAAVAVVAASYVAGAASMWLAHSREQSANSSPLSQNCATSAFSASLQGPGWIPSQLAWKPRLYQLDLSVPAMRAPVSLKAAQVNG